MLWSIMPSDVIIFMGDPNQISPFTGQANQQQAKVLSVGLAQLLKPDVTIKLTRNYRMLDGLKSLWWTLAAAHNLYPWRIDTSVNMATQRYVFSSPDNEAVTCPVPEIMVFNTLESAKRMKEDAVQSGRLSSYNRHEIDAVNVFLKYFRDCVRRLPDSNGNNNVEGSEAAFLSIFAKQVEEAEALLSDNEEMPIDFRTVTSSQGKTYNVVILSMVLSNPSLVKDFAKDVAKLIVQCSRQRYVLAVFMHPSLSHESLLAYVNDDNKHSWGPFLAMIEYIEGFQKDRATEPQKKFVGTIQAAIYQDANNRLPEQADTTNADNSNTNKALDQQRDHMINNNNNNNKPAAAAPNNRKRTNETVNDTQPRNSAPSRVNNRQDVPPPASIGVKRPNSDAGIQPCKYFNTQRGCNKGSNCNFLHDKK
jgi:hypothetical protein